MIETISTRLVLRAPADGPLVVLLHYASTAFDRPDTILDRFARLVELRKLTGLNVAMPLGWERWKDNTFHDPMRSTEDREFIRKVIDKLAGPWPVYIAGMSSGAFMAARYVLEAQDARVKGAAMVAGAILKYYPKKTPRVPLLMFNGTRDLNVPYTGAVGMLGAKEGAAWWGPSCTLYTIEGGSHAWPGSQFNWTDEPPSVDATSLIAAAARGMG